MGGEIEETHRVSLRRRKPGHEEAAEGRGRVVVGGVMGGSFKEERNLFFGIPGIPDKRGGLRGNKEREVAFERYLGRGG